MESLDQKVMVIPLRLHAENQPVQWKIGCYLQLIIPPHGEIINFSSSGHLRLLPAHFVFPNQSIIESVTAAFMNLFKSNPGHTFTEPICRPITTHQDERFICTPFIVLEPVK